MTAKNFSILNLLIGCIPLLCAESLTFDNTVKYFLKSNMDLSINQKELDKTKADLITAKNRPNPIISTSVQSLDSKHNFNNSTATTNISLNNSIELGQKRDRRIKNAQDNISYTALQIKEMEREKLFDLIDIFYQIASEQEALLNAQANFEDFRQLVKIAESKFEHGFLSSLDLDKMKLAEIDYKNEIDLLKTTFENDKLTLAFMLAMEPNSIEIASIGLPELIDKDVAELILFAQKNRSDYLAAHQAVEAANSFLELQKANAVPDLDVGLQYYGNGPNYSQTFSHSLIGLNASIPIPVFNQNKGEIEKSRINVLQASEQLKKILHQIELDINQAFKIEQTQFKLYADLKTGFELAKEIKNKEEKIFSLKGISILELLEAQRNYREYQSKLTYSKISLASTIQKLKLQSGISLVD